SKFIIHVPPRESDAACGAQTARAAPIRCRRMPGPKTARNKTQKSSQRLWATDRRLDPFLRESSTHSGANRSSPSAQANDSLGHQFQVQTPKPQGPRVRVARHVCEIQPGSEEAACDARTCARILPPFDVGFRAGRFSAQVRRRNLPCGHPEQKNLGWLL